MAFVPPSEMKHVPLTSEQRTELTSWLDTEIDQAEADRQGLIDRLKEEVRMYEAAPVSAEKQWPWVGASNLVVPVIPSMVDTIFPRVFSTVFGTDPVITVEDKDPEWSDHSKAVQRMLDLVQREELKLQRVSEDWFLEAIIHGTSVVKLVWDTLEKSVKSYDEEGNITEDKRRQVKNGPALYRVPLNEFYIPMYANSIEDAPWVAHKIRTYWGRLKQLEATGVYKNVDDIEFQTEFVSDDYVRTREDIEDTAPSFMEQYELFEIWMEYDYDFDGADEMLVVTYHRPSQTLLRVQFNPYWHMRKPFREFIYWPRHDRFYGIGIAAMVAAIQDEISTLHNQAIDNRTVSNTKMWEIVAGSTADRNFDGVAPGRVVKVDRLGEEIGTLDMGTPFTTEFADGEKMGLAYAQQRTGVSDFLSGKDLGSGQSRETATTTMVKMQEARTRFNWTMDSARQAIAEIAEMTTSLLHQFGDEATLGESLGEEDQDLISEFFSMEEDEVRSKIGLYVTASTASMNKEAEKQNLIALTQMLSQQTLTFEMPLVQLIINPAAPPALKEYAMGKLNGMRKLFDRILQTFDAKNADEILGSLRALETALEPQGPALGQVAPGPQGPANGPPPGGPGLGGPPGPVPGGV